MVKWVLIGLVLALPAQAEILAGHARVVDGDTLVIDAQKVRLFGIDAPEHDQLCKDAQGRDWPCGEAARDRLGVLAAGLVRCAGRGRDRYDRLLAVCSAGGRDLNAALVSEGMAEAYRKYARDYVPEEAQARAAQRGIWAGPHLAPEAVRRGPVQTPPGACRIKGNISKKGQIFHLPGSRDYDRTRIDETRGERWFCTEAEARAAGWRPMGS
ncbi:thermonuclease family protein [Rhodobacter capsulatus]|jgi:endonuclease YncB( thermonuclease family)|uniref:Nuclease family protein n=1 Tax=Rhodobacter capsulatus (strain ATCC BAA-309 / NBRC 16581 / SB1003) TaxID=272942 RepID=D5AQ77_RHOCB|nr:thermonuclease family protein [Rhodobacter capsulatus]ADE84664.1 nuclease family protein [Rhodobacter capsulatus SB 1003]ETD02625.1 succinoglycan biosynthesis protein [Rhodobacter capsulatus DE442]ETD78722.1 succinoglycan biosynthesis protein [Rhodobacter capsulatus R121]ETE54687.1 succinoglycan biosynthesis protein [Rhodobacter capsulatus Y262]MDS0926411.1 thermonuclease family protein [Rhodobacter capsulatus]